MAKLMKYENLQIYVYKLLWCEKYIFDKTKHNYIII